MIRGHDGLQGCPVPCVHIQQVRRKRNCILLSPIVIGYIAEFMAMEREKIKFIFRGMGNILGLKPKAEGYVQ